MALAGTFALRTLLEMARRATLQVDAPEHQGSIFTPTDATFIPIPAGKEKAARLARDPAKVSTILFHVTGVTGGFGVARSAVSRWERHPAAQTIEARTLALLERLRGTPYHEIVSREAGIIRNRDLAQRSYHGGPAGNHAAGFSLDMGSRETMPDDFWPMARAGLLDLAKRMQEAGAEPPFWILAHRQVEAPNRRGDDPGAIAWRNVVVPCVHEHADTLVTDLAHTANGGRPIPRSWDHRSPFDDRGNRP
jgi:hypothetical protein